MKNKATKPSPQPSEGPLALPDTQVSDFEPLPADYAPTCPVPEPQPAVPLPEYRQPQTPTEGESTLALPIQDFSPVKTADIPPALLPNAHPKALHAAQGSASMAEPTATQQPTTGGSRPRWVGAGIVVLLLAAGGTTWYLWPQPQAGSAEALSEAPPGAPASNEAVPPELRAYMEQARGGDAKAMHMMALMYWNGLNVRQDRPKGLDWYRKAAAAGDQAAQKELHVIEGK